MIMVQALLVAGVPAAEIRCYPLDDRTVYTVRVSLTEPTTCVFPGALKALVGANLSSRIDEKPGILISHEPGAEYFSLRALTQGAVAALNIVYRGKVYALAFVTDAEPDRAVVFLDEPVAGTGQSRRSRDALAALLERTKQIARLPTQSGMTPRIARATPGNTTPYRSFSATIESVTRFEPEDAMVFRVRLENRTEAAVPYDPHGLAIRLGPEFFPVVLSDGSGSIPAKGSVTIHLLIVGAPGGGRANLSVEENFSVIVPHS